MINTELLTKVYPDEGKARTITDILNVSPYMVLPTVTISDAKKGYITRYFTYKINDEDYIIEVDNDQYDKLKDNPRFVTVSIEWKIVGKKENTRTPFGAAILGVLDFNREQIRQADLTFEHLHKYISDYSQYWLGESV